MLAAGEGLEKKGTAERLSADPNRVGKWRRRFGERLVDGLYDEPRPAAPRQIEDEAIAEVVRRTFEEAPPDATHWSLRLMATAVGHAPSTSHRIWQTFGLQPHSSKSFKRSGDPLFVEKVRDIVGLYFARPERALVLWVDEKSQVQALSRPGRCRCAQVSRNGAATTIPRHGTTLFATLDITTGTIIGRYFAP